ncbi:MAG: ATP-binding protein [Bacteroidota bacterium]
MSDKKHIFQQIIVDFFEKSLDHVRSRRQNIPKDIPKIISLMGPRRAGKTYTVFEVVKELRKSIPSNRLVYVNFEDDRLFPLELSDMNDLLEAYYELFPKNKDVCVWFFFDEIQEVPHWEKFIRRMFDQENCRIYLTGSSSKLLSRELASALRGRSIPFEIFPLSFREFLDFHQITFNAHSSKGQALLLHHAGEYIQQGGFPELFFLPKELHNRVINEYIDLMLYRDLSERFSIKHPHLMKYLLKHLVVNMAKPISINKVYNDIKSQNYKAGKNTVYDYISYLEEAFIVLRVDLWTASIRKQAINPSKIYIIDPSIKYAMSIQQDTGRVFENMIFLELRRRGIHPNYVQTKQEVDFYWVGGRLINACYNYREASTREREIKGLLEAMDKMNLVEAEMINWDRRETLVFGDKRIQVKAVWDFLLA